jgi:hypothetical protein
MLAKCQLSHTADESKHRRVGWLLLEQPAPVIESRSWNQHLLTSCISDRLGLQAAKVQCVVHGIASGSEFGIITQIHRLQLESNY